MIQITAMNNWRRVLRFVAMLAAVTTLHAKEPPAQVIMWPNAGAPIVQFSFGKFKEIGSVGSQRTYVIDTTAENVWTKPISNANFSLYLFDKNKVRIGDGFINLSSIAPGETVKFQTTISSSGTPSSVSLVAKYLPPELSPLAPLRMISLTVNSVPQGATLKIDGNEAGTTPKIVKLAVGSHVLEFSKESFNTGKYPLEITADDASGGSVSYELGTSAHDTVEMRDGSILTGDLESVSSTQVVIRIGGSMQQLNRNQVKRIVLVERDSLSQ
jgi:PEGA domain